VPEGGCLSTVRALRHRSGPFPLERTGCQTRHHTTFAAGLARGGATRTGNGTDKVEPTRLRRPITVATRAEGAQQEKHG
jgi:hypothetical protein